MKYKIGDRVKIKKKSTYSPDAITDLKKVNYTVTIKKVEEGYYIMEEISEWGWVDDNIERLIPEVISLFPTTKRFELMDI